jgi:formylglycine-generating enzyme required for sulfatase activity
MGRVFLCRDRSLDAEVAVKVLPAEVARDPAAMEGIRSEAKVAARLRQGPGILTLYSLEEHEGACLLVMEYAPGGTLEDRLRREGPLPEDEARRLGAEVADALAFAHERGVLHRDIKAANILLDAGGRVRVADMGMARVLEAAAARLSHASIAGTPVTMAPEVMWRGRVDHRADLYSLGCLLFHAVTGGYPFTGGFADIAGMKASPDGGVPDPRARRPDLSGEFAGIVRRLLDPDPERRYATAAEVAAALRGVALPPLPAGAPARPGVLPPPRPFVIAASERFSQRWKAARAPLLGILATAAAAGLATLVLTGTWPVRAPEGAERGAGAGSAGEPVGGPPSPGSEGPGRGNALPDAGGAAAETSPPPANASAPALSPAVPGLPPPPQQDLAGLTLPPGFVLVDGRVYSEKDGTELVLVPGGDFTMGREGERSCPPHRVLVSPFLMDRCEVSNAQFSRFVEETGYRTTAERAGNSWCHVQGGEVQVNGACWRHPEGPGSGVDDLPRFPVCQVSWQDAVEYARWAGRRLPTEAEFERAIRGGAEGSLYPWGDSLPPPEGFGNLPGLEYSRKYHGTLNRIEGYEDGFADAAPVGSFRQNPFGLFDVVGNLLEWCEDRFAPDYGSPQGDAEGPPERDPPGSTTGPRRVRRGGAFCWMDSIKCHGRASDPPVLSKFDGGFRCAASLPAAGTEAGR